MVDIELNPAFLPPSDAVVKDTVGSLVHEASPSDVGGTDDAIDLAPGSGFPPRAHAAGQGARGARSKANCAR